MPKIQTSPFFTIRSTIFLIALPFGILEFVLPIYGKSIGAGAVQIGLFFSVFSLMTVLLRPLIGAGLDHYGRRVFYIAGLAGYALTMLAFAFSDQVWGILLARTLQGVASAFLWLSAQAITADLAADSQRGRSFGGIEQSANQGALLGTTFGMFVIIWIGIEKSWQPLFLLYSALALVSVLLALLRLKESLPARTTRNQSRIVWSRPWILLLLVTVVTAASWTMVSPILMIYLQDKLHTGVDELALAFLPAALVWALLPTRLGRLADRFGRKPLMLFGLLVAAVTSFLIPGLSSLLGLTVLWAVQALSYAAGDPAEQALVADLTGGEQRGRGFGLYAMSAGIGATLGPFVGGWLYQEVDPGAPFFANGLILLANFFILWIFLQLPARTTEDDGGSGNYERTLNDPFG